MQEGEILKAVRDIRELRRKLQETNQKLEALKKDTNKRIGQLNNLLTGEIDRLSEEVESLNSKSKWMTVLGLVVGLLLGAVVILWLYNDRSPDAGDSNNVDQSQLSQSDAGNQVQTLGSGQTDQSRYNQSGTPHNSVTAAEHQSVSGLKNSGRNAPTASDQQSASGFNTSAGTSTDATEQASNGSFNPSNPESTTAVGPQGAGGFTTSGRNSTASPQGTTKDKPASQQAWTTSRNKPAYTSSTNSYFVQRTLTNGVISPSSDPHLQPVMAHVDIVAESAGDHAGRYARVTVNGHEVLGTAMGLITGRGLNVVVIDPQGQTRAKIFNTAVGSPQTDASQEFIRWIMACKRDEIIVVAVNGDATGMSSSAFSILRSIGAHSYSRAQRGYSYVLVGSKRAANNEVPELLANERAVRLTIVKAAR